MSLTAQLVDSISDAASVRLDLNDGVTWQVLARGTSTPPPPLQRVVVSSPMADGDLYPSDRYGNRLVTVALNLLPTDLDQAAAAVQTLQRELARQPGILRWRPGTTGAVYFRLARGEADVRWDEVARRVTVRAPAEPWAYGPKETLPQVAVSNDPAAGANGCCWDVTGVKGDAETPLFARFSNTVVAVGRRQSAIAVRRRGTPSSAPFVLQAESMTPGMDTTLQANDTAMSGAGANFMRCTFTNPGMENRLTIATFPAVAGEDVRGRYRAFVRYRRSSATGTINMRLVVSLGGPGNEMIVGETAATRNTIERMWIDLGEVQFPAGNDPVVDGYSGTQIPVRGHSLWLQAERLSGTSTLDFDVMLLPPCDDRFALVKWTDDGAPSGHVADPTLPGVYSVGAAGEVVSTTLAELDGDLPMISPGVTNRIYFLLNAGTQVIGDIKTSSTTVNQWYWPRYLHVRPVAS